MTRTAQMVNWAFLYLPVCWNMESADFSLNYIYKQEIKASVQMQHRNITITFVTPSKVHNRYCRQTAVQLLSVFTLVISVNIANITHHTDSCHGKVEAFQG